MPFIYFLPGVRAVNDERLDAACLGHVRTASWSAGAIERGPSGGAGCLVAAEGLELRYDGEAQEWRHIEAASVWVGWPRGNPPGPSELARADFVDGHEVRLADGRLWTVPLARVLGLGGPRQRAYRLGPGGKLVPGEAISRLGDIAQEAAVVWEEIETQVLAMAAAIKAGGKAEGVSVTLRQDLALKALAVNYRIGGPEVDALRLLDTTNVASVLLALIDWPTVEARLKNADSPDPI